MGKAYRNEMSSLAETYRWACEVPLGPLADFAVAAYERPLLAVGSGGSATAAHLAAMLHRYHAAAFARNVTPLDVLLGEPSLRDGAVLLLSASGKNRDVLAALKRSTDHEARAIGVLCTRRGSPLAAAANRCERAYVFEADSPAGKDGFLATNSLLASCTIIARVYGIDLSPCIPSFEREPLALGEIAGRSSALILYGGWGGPIATDLESKLHESTLASAQVTDFRNFGHGRHLWLARRAMDSVVVSVVTPETRALADRTRALLPPDVPIVELRTPHRGPVGTIDLLVQGYKFVGRLGELQGFDPGRPDVPDFGRKLYHLAPSVPLQNCPSPVTRKLGRSGQFTPASQDKVQRALEEFVEQLSSSQFGAAVLDYDGTLCTRSERFGGLRLEIAAQLQRLLEGGLLIGIATGRGRSVRESLQKALPRPLWDGVLIGYYNGGDIGHLSRDDVPSRTTPPEHPLDLASELLARDPLLVDIAKLTLRRRQITVEPIEHISTAALVSHVMTALAPIEVHSVRVLASSHSVDVLAPGVTKLAVVEALKQRISVGTEVLCIGDRGAWPGNDYALLSHWPSLSVDDVSSSLRTCWNLAPYGTTGIEATLAYLESIRVSDGIANFDARYFWRR